MVVFIRSSDFNHDPRISKYIDTLTEKNISFIVIGWDRGGQKLKRKNYFYFYKKAKYGAKQGNYLNKFAWMLFVLKTLFQNRKKIKVIHAADFESVFPAMLFSMIFRKRFIFDIFDWIGNSNKKDPFLIRTIEKIENIIVKKADAIILCEKERRNQISEKILKKVLVMPNIPNIKGIEDNNNIFEEQNIDQIDKFDLILSYVGVFDYNRGIENLLEYAEKNKNILLLIGGYGGLEEIVLRGSKNSNIIYFGKVDYPKALNIIRSSDLLYACYYTTNPVHKYAAPNKFYESLICSTPLITTQHTLVGNKVEEFDTGYTIGESYGDLEGLLSNKDLKKSLEIKSENCTGLWNNCYKEYIPRFMNDEYIPLLEQLSGEKEYEQKKSYIY